VKGNKRWIFIFNPSAVAIKRHVKVISQANPYDPAYCAYFDARQKRNMRIVIAEKEPLRTLYKKQKGICPICQQSITAENGWHVHHIMPKAKGGTDEISNLVLLHPNCHRQYHVNTNTLTQPAPPKGLSEARAVCAETCKYGSMGRESEQSDSLTRPLLHFAIEQHDQGRK
jgi:RNA-directed DNA polymerase